MFRSCLRGRERITETTAWHFSLLFLFLTNAQSDRLPWSQIVSVKVLEATYSPPSPPGLWFISCFLSEAPFMSLFSTRRGIRSLTATSTVAASDVLSWNRSSFPPTESRREAVNLTKRDWRGWARQVLSFPLVCEVDDLLGFPVIFYNTINNHLLCALDKLSSGVFKDCFFLTYVV